MPIFFPDATRAVVKTVDATDIRNTQTPGVLVNTYHLYRDLGKNVFKKFKGVNKFMNWEGAIISDSGGFQIMSLVKKFKKRGAITDNGVTFHPPGAKKILFTPEKSIDFQMALTTDLMVVLDDFTPPEATYDEAKKTVERTIAWAKRSKAEFQKHNCRPYLIGVVQGGQYLDLRKECTQRLVAIGFDGLGYGGWPIKNGQFDYEVARVMAENSPQDYLLYGLGVGKPDEIVNCYKLGFQIFDCVLPTRDARHQRLYVYNADAIGKIDVFSPNFYSYFTPTKEKYFNDDAPVSKACDCLLCQNYSRAYLSHLFKIRDVLALRLATIHNLRFYAILMEKLRPKTSRSF